jgi:hypothetical protein
MFSFLNDESAVAAGHRIPVVFPKPEDLPKSSYGYKTNNKYPGAPPLMCDGRSIIASWQPEADANNAILKQNNIKSNWEYRQYLTNNGLDLMRRNFVESANDVGHYERNTREVGESVPFKSVCSSTTCKPFVYSSILEQPRHLGNVHSDLKENYLSREQLSAQQFSPVITQDELLRMKSGKK